MAPGVSARRCGGASVRRQAVRLPRVIQRRRHVAHPVGGLRGRIQRRQQIRVQPPIDAERPIRQLAHAPNLGAQLVGRQVQRRKNAESAGARHFRHQLSAGHPPMPD